MKSPINWYGGKYYMTKRLVPIIAHIPHVTYVEVFGGAAHLLFAKPPSKIEVYNDLHEGLVNFWRVLRDDPDTLQQKLTLTPYARAEYVACQGWRTVTDPVEKARQFYVALMQSFSQNFSTWSYSKTTTRQGMSKPVSAWLTNIETEMPAVLNRLRTLQIENADFATIITRYDTPNTLFYLDPPYLPETRVAPKMYQHEMSYADHERLVTTLKDITGKAILSGYANPLYDTLGWQKHNIGGYAAYALKVDPGGTKSRRTEYVWLKTD